MTEPLPLKVLIVCAKRYNGHELWTLLKRLRVHDVAFEVVSQETLIRDELTLQPNTIARTVYEVSPDEMDLFDGICVVSGNMADTEAYWTDEAVITLLKRAQSQKKVIAAICCSVPTLAPVAKGVRVAPFPLVRNRHRLLRFGAILEKVSICVDEEHRTVTAENQMMTHLWADNIVKILKGQEITLKFSQSSYADSFRGKTPKRLPKEIEATLTKFRPTPATINKPKE